MINNPEEKEFLNKQIVHLENALADLKDKLLPDNPKMYEVMSLNYIDKIKELRKEIDLYLGIQENNLVRNSDIIIRLQGPEVGFGKAPISVVANTLEEMRKGFQNLYASLLGYKNYKKVPQYIAKACDMSLAGVFEGSIQVALQRPPEQISLFQEDTDFERTANLYIEAASWASKMESVEVIKRKIPDDDIREVALKSILRLVPNSPKRVNRVHLYGSMIKEDIYLGKNSRDFIIENLTKKDKEEIIYSFEGRVREIDLDKGSFKLREIKNEENIYEIIGIINDKLMSDIKESLDETVIVRGTMRNETNNAKTIEVRFIENISSPD